MFRTWLHLLIPLLYVFMTLVAAGVYKGLFYKSWKQEHTDREGNWRYYRNFDDYIKYYSEGDFNIGRTIFSLFWFVTLPFLLIVFVFAKLLPRLADLGRGVTQPVARAVEKLRE